MLGLNRWLTLGASLLLAVVLGVSHVGAYRAGKNSVIAAQAKATQAHDANVEKAERASRASTQETGHTIEAKRNERSAKVDHARAVIGPVRLCSDTAPAKVPRAPEPAPATDSTKAGEGLSLRARDSAQAPAVVPEDIGPGLIALMEACQADHDDARWWREWWETQHAIAAAPSF